MGNYYRVARKLSYLNLDDKVPKKEECYTMTFSLKVKSKPKVLIAVEREELTIAVDSVNK